MRNCKSSLWEVVMLYKYNYHYNYTIINDIRLPCNPVLDVFVESGRSTDGCLGNWWMNG